MGSSFGPLRPRRVLSRFRGVMEQGTAPGALGTESAASTLASSQARAGELVTAQAKRILALSKGRVRVPLEGAFQPARVAHGRASVP